MSKIVVIAHDIRSTHNIGALFRTCEGLGIAKLYLTGYTPYPNHQADIRLPHESRKTTAQIEKTALGTTLQLPWEHHQDAFKLIKQLRKDGFCIIGLEQHKDARPLPDYQLHQNICLVLGREVEGLATEVIELCDELVEIPMKGEKESFNVVQAAAMCLYHFRYIASHSVN